MAARSEGFRLMGPAVHLPPGAQGLWTWDVKRDMVFADATMASLFGIPASVAAQGAPVAIYLRSIADEDERRVREAIEAALVSGAAYREVFRVDGDQGRKLVMASGQCYFDEEGKPHLYPGVVTDLGRISVLTTEALSRIEQLLTRMHEIGSRELIDYMVDLALEELRDLKGS